MELNEEQLTEITRLGAAAYNPKQTAFALGISPATFLSWLKDDEHAATIAYFKGFYSSELAIREGVFLLARSGSSPAQTLALKLFDETRIKIISDEITTNEI